MLPAAIVPPNKAELCEEHQHMWLSVKAAGLGGHIISAVVQSNRT